MDESAFRFAIEQHLELQRRNGRLERRMPLDRYRDEVIPGPDSRREPQAAADEASSNEDGNGSVPADPDSWWEPPSDWDG